MHSIGAVLSLILVQSVAGSDAQSPAVTEARVREWAAGDPDAFWPYWAQGKGLAWTVTGLPGVPEVGLFSHDAAAGGTAWPFTLSVWVQDVATGRWVAPESRSPDEVSIELRSGHLPIPRAEVGAELLRLGVEYAIAPAGSEFPSGVAVLRARVTNTTDQARRARLAVAVRPYLVDGRLGSVRSLRWERDVVWVNESIPIAPDRVPDDHVEGDLACSGRDLSRLLLEGESQPVCDAEAGLQAGAFLFSLTMSARSTQSVAVLVPAAPVAPDPALIPAFRRLGAEELAARAAAHWRARLLDVPLAIPDPAVDRVLRASVAYALIGRSDAPGLFGDGAAYRVAALLRAGLTGAATDLATEMLLARAGVPASAGGWDRTGQAIFAISEVARFTADSALARRHWAAVRRAAETLRRARAPMAHDSMRGGVGFGILPATAAPHHLGGGEGHHLWDDFWTIRGLRDAASLAELAGRADEAAWMPDEAAALERALEVALRQIQLVTRIDWIPLGPEDLESPAAARSTCAGLWPAAGLQPGDTLVRRSFDRYWERWIAPNEGAYIVRGHHWPGVLEVALCEIRSERPERAHAILRRHLTRPTFPGALAWAEQTDPQSFTYAGGPIPDPWVAADYVNLVRSMLLHERGDTLVLGAGIVLEWLEAGRVEARGAPSAFGPISFRVTAEDGRVVWEILDAGRAPTLRLNAPPGRVITAAEIDDGWTRRGIRTGAVVLGAGHSRVELTVESP